MTGSIENLRTQPIIDECSKTQLITNEFQHKHPLVLITNLSITTSWNETAFLLKPLGVTNKPLIFLKLTTNSARAFESPKKLLRILKQPITKGKTVKYQLGQDQSQHNSALEEPTAV